MNRCLTSVLVTGLLVAAIAASKGDDTVKDEVAKKDADNIQGKWQIVSQEIDGKTWKSGEASENFVVIDKDTYTWMVGGKVNLKSTFKLDPSKKPKAIDTTMIENKLIPESKGMVIQGTYDLDGDTLRLAQPWPGYTDRPKEFTTKKGNRFAVETYKRVKP